MSNFVALLEPPGLALDSWDHNKRVTDQPNDFPRIFLDAMIVREDVFVDEQKCSLVNEVDEDDPKSYHWVVYASIGSPSPSATTPQQGFGSLNGAALNGDTEQSPITPSASSIPIGTIRLVPPPHPPHPLPAAPISHNAVTVHAVPKYHEPYVKLTRLAVSAPYRHLKLGRLLVNTALNWASSHPNEVQPLHNPTELEEARAKVRLDIDRGILADEEEVEKSQKWKGLVLIHAQKERLKFWEKMGFVHDEGLGEWDEEGILHVAMWRRVDIKEDKNGRLMRNESVGTAVYK
jgi:predicted GNAT family N-acyltransferase